VKGYVPDQRSWGAADRPERSAVELPEELDLDFSPEELHEFLAGDLVEVPADPAFKQALREKLRAFVQERYGPAVSGRPRPLQKS
jgi:hypothetical protein